MAKILMADDEPNILKLAGDMLRSFGYEVITVSDGVTAFEKAVSEKPNLIILDRNMPGMNGLEVCKKIRDTEPICNTPVIFLTAQDSHEEFLEGVQEGATDYITKPFNLNELKKRIDELLIKKPK